VVMSSRTRVSSRISFFASSGEFQRFGSADWASNCVRRFSLDGRSKTLQKVAEFLAGGGQALRYFFEDGHGRFL
jgi:hypothetical protein